MGSNYEDYWYTDSGEKIVYPEDRGSIFLRNFGNDLKDYPKSHLGRAVFIVTFMRTCI
jgi:hypothetical protein